MPHRLLDPATSTRRTPAARERLAASPMTAALLDAGVRLLLAELEAPFGEGARLAPGEDAPPARFFECLSAARVCAAATAVGPLRVTAAHLRDRWPRHDGYVDDLLSYALWFEHHFEGPIAEVLEAPVGLPPGAGIDDVVVLLAETNLYTVSVPVTSRVEVLSCVLALSRPWLRAVQRTNYALYDAAWDAAFARLLPALGLRLRAGTGPADVARAGGCLGEGVNLRFLAHGQTASARETAVGDFALGCAALVRAWTEPDPSPAGAAAATAPPPEPLPAPPAPRARLADVLRRLTDPATGTRRTEASRRRLADDVLTAQLLDGGLAVLAEEFGVGGGGVEPRFFAALSGARVVAEARAAGHPATAGQLRDRWPLQDHYLDDLVAHALAQQPAGISPLLEGTARDDAAVRVRLLLTTMAARTGAVAGLADLHRRSEDAVREQLERTVGADLRGDVDVAALARVVVAVSHGAETRVLATGDDDGAQAAAALEACRAAVRGCLA